MKPVKPAEKPVVVPGPVKVEAEPKKAEPVVGVDPGKFSPEGVGTV